MHSIPRGHEIATEIDEDPRAMYWEQERNGMWIRAALIAHMFGIDKQILAYNPPQASQ
jgi:aspartate carbamoyltransferase catalytic subunit